MNQNNASNGEDADVMRYLTLLKQIEPTLEARVDCRLKVARELAQLRSHSRRISKAWWKNSISIPVPLALAMGILLIAFVWLTQRQSRRDASDDIRGSQITHFSDRGVRYPDESSVVDSHEGELELHITGIYLCGVGALITESRYEFSESIK